MKITSVVGARPQFVKLAPVAEALHGRAEHVIVHTGQHYDALMSDVFFEDLAIPQPDVNLRVGSDSHGAQTGAMLAAVEDVLSAQRPDWVLVYGDTNSTLAAALAAVKLHLPVAHLEAGLRSFNRRMPEEHNRVLTDHAADLLLAPTKTAVENLSLEGLGDRSVQVGDVMADVCLRMRALQEAKPAPSGLPERYLFATVHRADNTDDPRRLQQIVDALGALHLPVVLAAHPRLVAKASGNGIVLDRDKVHTVRPLAYPDLVRVLLHCSGVITDSGGLQKEAYVLGVPCTTVRTETEWIETLERGWNTLCPDAEQLADIVAREPPNASPPNIYGNGRAARLVAEALLEHESSTRPGMA